MQNRGKAVHSLGNLAVLGEDRCNQNHIPDRTRLQKTLLALST